jgi:hypothetical protein
MWNPKGSDDVYNNQNHWDCGLYLSRKKSSRNWFSFFSQLREGDTKSVRSVSGPATEKFTSLHSRLRQRDQNILRACRYSWCYVDLG